MTEFIVNNTLLVALIILLVFEIELLVLVLIWIAWQRREKKALGGIKRTEYSKIIRRRTQYAQGNSLTRNRLLTINLFVFMVILVMMGLLFGEMLSGAITTPAVIYTMMVLTLIFTVIGLVLQRTSLRRKAEFMEQQFPQTHAYVNHFGTIVTFSIVMTATVELLLWSLVIAYG